MIAARRLGRARHEFRFGRRELITLGAVFCLIIGLVFAVGVLVGREMARGKGVAARVEAAREPGRGDADGLRGEAPVKTAATRTEEKVTFYRTLTAPTLELPQVGKPTIEERLVPKEEPSAAGVEVPPESTRAGPERTPRAPEAAMGPRLGRSTRAASTPPTPPVRPPPTQVPAPTAGAEPEAWTVQVSAFRSRALAEELRARLAARGFDVYVLPSVTEEGRPRYRVRVGAYASRSDAEQVAAELRRERGLNPLVTSRAR
jgi:cell division septation protein DedD